MYVLLTFTSCLHITVLSRILICSADNLSMKIILNHHILHAVDHMVQDLTMSLNITDHRVHLLTTNRHIADVAVADSGGVDIHHHLLIGGCLSIGVVLRGDVATGEEAVTIQIQVGEDETVPVIRMINHRHPSNTTDNQELRRLTTTLIVRESKPERRSLKRTARIPGAKCL